jgi:hypothetical protein
MKRLLLLLLLLMTTAAYAQQDSTILVGGKLIFIKPSKKTKPVVIRRQAARTILSGSGSGELNLNGVRNRKIKIRPGTYSHITVNNARNVKIDATNVRIVSGSLDIFQSDYLEIYGLAVTDVPYRAVNIRGYCNDLYFHDMRFKNIGNNTISYEYVPVYDGTEQTISKNWKLERLTFEQTGTAFSAGGGISNNNITGILRNFKFLNNTIRNCPTIGNVIWAGAVDNYEIAGNIVDNVNKTYPKNAPNGIHNGIFMMTGTGSFHHNKITNHQGNAIRAWGINFGRTKNVILIYNNIVYNSWKYGAFELQATPDIQAFITRNPSKASYADASVYNNTAGRLNRSKDWEGQLLDLYSTGGTVEYFNNLGFEMNRSQGVITDMINRNGDTKVIRNTNNRYFKTQIEAVTNTNSFDSKYKSLGSTAFSYQ